MASIFFTGFPGFLGSELLPRVLSRAEDATAVCLVQPKYAPTARQRLAAVEDKSPELRGRVQLVEGDITRGGFGVADSELSPGEISEIYHLAAVYDLAVGRDLAMRVNVDGTRHVLDFAERCSRLSRFQYVSTCYVSGTTPGVFTEDDLERGQRFNNFYEETKQLAEVDVRRRMAAGMPGTIYRPSIVVGDSTTGETQKYDGPYFVVQLLLRQPALAVAPVSGNPANTYFNAVPRDFVVGAIAHLSGMSQSLGKTYQLADPKPLTFDAMLADLARATGRKMIRVPLPLGVAKWALDHVPGVGKLFRIPSHALDYQVHPTRYDTTNASADLAGSGISCPPFPTYSDVIVRFARAHPEIGAAAMI